MNLKYFQILRIKKNYINKSAKKSIHTHTHRQTNEMHSYKPFKGKRADDDSRKRRRSTEQKKFSSVNAFIYF